MEKDSQLSELYHKAGASQADFLTWVSANIGGPHDALERYLGHAIAAAAAVQATLDTSPILDGRRHYLPSLSGKRDQRQFYVGNIRTDSDGSVWPAITFGTFKHGGDTVYWCPRDSAWHEYRSDPVAKTDRLDQYRARAEAAQAAARARADEAERQARLGQAEAQRAAQAAWAAGLPAETHPYLTRKGISVPGLRIASSDLRHRLFSDGEWRERLAVRQGDLLVPMYLDGVLVNLQRINDGKWFLPGGQTKGCHFRIEGGARIVLAEGLATGASWHQATGDTVIVTFGAGNLAKVAAYIQADLVAADHDASGAGEKAARATGLPFLMPPICGHDWNDHVLRFGPGELLAALAEVPIFAQCPPKSERFELKGNHKTWWRKFGAADTPEAAARWAWSLALKRCVRIPVVQSLEALIDELRLNAPAGLVRSETFEAIRSCLERMGKWRQDRALSSVTLSHDITRRHRHEFHENLPNLVPGEYRGVILLKAPMGSGKTQLIGHPFSDWAKTQPGVFLAICHRRSLVRELANRLTTDHYTEVDQETAFGTKALATCLPSLVKDQHQQIMEGARYLFIDEISQVLRSLDAHVTIASGKTKSELFTALREIVSHADCLIGADAGLDDRTVRFLESCRPGERFRIIDVSQTNEGKRAQFGFGQEALASAYGEALTRLAAGERLWIGCGEQTRAVEVARVLESSGRRILLLHGNNTGHAESVAFYVDPEGESRRYDAVIHTSVISSGISIEHRGRPHFDHGLFFASGATTTPADAAQMLCRVRYLRTWTIVATANNARDITDDEAILAAVSDAAKLEGNPGDCTDLDRFVAGIRAADALARADFAPGLLWLLQHQRFQVERLSAQFDHALDVAGVRDELKAEHVRRILEAELIGEDDYIRLSRASEQTEEARYQILKCRIRLDMGARELDADIIDEWDCGRGPARMDRFSAATLNLAGLDDSGADLTLRRFHKARVLAYQLLFAGIDLGPALRITGEVAATIMARVIRHRFMLAYLGLVSAKFAADPDRPFPMPAYPLREVGEILSRMGLKTRRREGGLTPRCGNHSNIEPDHVGVNSTDQVRTRFYEITADSWNKMAWWTERRNKFRRTEEVSVPDWHSMTAPGAVNESAVTDDVTQDDVIERPPGGCIRMYADGDPPGTDGVQFERPMSEEPEWNRPVFWDEAPAWADADDVDKALTDWVEYSASLVTSGYAHNPL